MQSGVRRNSVPVPLHAVPKFGWDFQFNHPTDAHELQTVSPARNDVRENKDRRLPAAISAVKDTPVVQRTFVVNVDSVAGVGLSFLQLSKNPVLQP